MSFFAELKRRNVVRVGIAYVVASWLLLQLTDVLTELLELNTDVGKIVIILLIVGFIPALIFAWAFEMTPEGIKRETEVDRSQSIAPKTGRKLDWFIIAVLAIALGYFIFDEFQDREREQQAAAIAQEQIASAVEEAPAEITPSIAVLPFADMSPDGDQGYFSDGISEELLNLLVRVDGLKVASRTSSFAYKGSNQSIAEIAGALKVDHVLEGSVRKAENRVRITAQLIDAQTDRHLWSDTFDREMVDIFAIQDEIATAIVDALQTELGVLQDASTITVDAATENLDAYELYLKARALFMARQDLPESMRLFEQAVKLDSEFARAWEGLAAVYSVAIGWGYTDRDYKGLSVEMANRALALNPALSLAWAVKGTFALDAESDLAAALGFYARAIEADPMNATAYLWRSIAWAQLGFFDQSIADLEQCLEIDPLYSNCDRHMGLALVISGQQELGLEYYQKGAEIGFFGYDPTFAAYLVERGDRLAAALGIWHWYDRGNGQYPAGLILDLMEFPGQDPRPARDALLAWLDLQDEDFVDTVLVEEYILVGAYELVTPIDNNSYIWSKYAKRYRRSEYFKALVNEIGLLQFWRAEGFPPMCRAIGDEDFECD